LLFQGTFSPLNILLILSILSSTFYLSISTFPRISQENVKYQNANNSLMEANWYEKNPLVEQGVAVIR